MTKNDALQILDQVCRTVPMNHNDHERTAQSFLALMNGEGDQKAALVFLDAVAKLALLVRADYELSRQAVQFLGAMNEELAS